jgi:hypothetical protein
MQKKGYSFLYTVSKKINIKKKINELFNNNIYFKEIIYENYENNENNNNQIIINNKINENEIMNLNIYEIYIGKEKRIANIIIINSNKYNKIFINWNLDLKMNLLKNNIKNININKILLKEQDLSSIKNNSFNKIYESLKTNSDNSFIKILIKLYESLKTNSDNIILLYFFNQIILLYELNNYKKYLLKIFYVYFDNFIKIINYNVNIYSKLIITYKYFRDYILKYSNTNNQNDMFILIIELKKILFNFSIKPSNNYFNSKSDFLIISYNENGKEFSDNDCISMLFKILLEEPSIIILCTQESSSNKNYQDMFKLVLQNWNYRNINIYQSKNNVKTSLYIKNDLFWFPKYDKFTKNIEMKKYFYINKNGILFKEFKPQRTDKQNFKYQYFADQRDIISEGEILNKFILKKSSILISKNINTLGLELIIEKENECKFIIINCKLFNKNNDKSGLEKREKEFFEIINEFKLLDYFRKGYNIFFCGDLNFNLYDVDEKINKENIINRMVYNYFTNNKNKFYKKYKNKNELLLILKKKNANNLFRNNLFKNFISSINLIGYDLTCKYKSSDEEFQNKNENKDFNYLNKNNKLIVPSMCDRFLFALNDEIIINNDHFSIYSIPKKSNHRIITLSFDLQFSILNN